MKKLFVNVVVLSLFCLMGTVFALHSGKKNSNDIADIVAKTTIDKSSNGKMTLSLSDMEKYLLLFSEVNAKRKLMKPNEWVALINKEKPIGISIVIVPINDENQLKNESVVLHAINFKMDGNTIVADIDKVTHGKPSLIDGKRSYLLLDGFMVTGDE